MLRRSASSLWAKAQLTTDAHAARLKPRPFKAKMGTAKRNRSVKRITTIAEMKAACRQATRNGKTLGFVPTMGALHEGHLSLVRASRSRCDVTAVSIFVNPLQFGPAEDLEKYPRPLERDAALLDELGVDASVHAGSAGNVSPRGADLRAGGGLE